LSLSSETQSDMVLLLERYFHRGFQKRKVVVRGQEAMKAPPSSPSPKTHRLSPHNERFILAFKTKTGLFPHHGPVPVYTALSEQVLDFIHMVLITPVLKDHTVHGPGGITSFEVALAQIIASAGLPPPEAAAAAPPPPPPAQSATRPRPADVETAVTPQKAKRVKFQPAPPINPATSKGVLRLLPLQHLNVATLPRPPMALSSQPRPPPPLSHLPHPCTAVGNARASTPPMALRAVASS
jgi:hypothetical protein